jgi:hypothetical protein
MRFRDIEQFPRSNYQVDVLWPYLEKQLAFFEEAGGLELCPDFQRGHAWSKSQQIAYLEYFLRGGPSGRDIYFNSPGWNSSQNRCQTVLVDGLQRLTAARAFMGNELKVFGYYYEEYTDGLRLLSTTFLFHVASLQTRAEVLRWYIAFNAGGTPHSAEEIARVKKLLRRAEREEKQRG